MDVSWTIKKAERWRIDVFYLWCWRRPSIRVFSNESTLCMRWPKDWSFSFSIIPSKEWLQKLYLTFFIYIYIFFFFLTHFSFRYLKPLNTWHFLSGFPGGASGKELACQCRRCKGCRIDPWAGKIPGRRAWQPAPVFLPGESHGQRSLEGYGP